METNKEYWETRYAKIRSLISKEETKKEIPVKEVPIPNAIKLHAITIVIPLAENKVFKNEKELEKYRNKLLSMYALRGRGTHVYFATYEIYIEP